MLGYYNYTVILTYIGALFAFAGISFAAQGELKAALICLMLSGLCDMFDGKIASTMKRTRSEKDFGIQIDSLSDLVCFGVLPGASVMLSRKGDRITGIVCGLYFLCALIRLAYFNVDEAERQATTEESRKIYKGLPVTSSAILFPLTYAVTRALHGATTVPMVVVMALTGIAFLTPFSLKKPAAVGKIVLIAAGLGTLTMLLIFG